MTVHEERTIYISRISIIVSLLYTFMSRAFIDFCQCKTVSDGVKSGPFEKYEVQKQVKGQNQRHSFLLGY